MTDAMKSNAGQARVWLSREGKTAGPFTSDQIRAMKASGEFSKYAWSWEENDRNWKPIHPVPPPPTAAASTPVSTPAHSHTEASAATTAPAPAAPASAPAPAAHAPATQSQSAETAHLALARAFSAVCHDNKHIIGGTIASITQQEGRDGFFHSTDHLDEFPPFRKGHMLWVNLLDENSGKSENVRATIVSVKKNDNFWEYRLQWKELPKMLSA
jgi:hypothetical protein